LQREEAADEGDHRGIPLQLDETAESLAPNAVRHRAALENLTGEKMNPDEL